MKQIISYAVILILGFGFGIAGSSVNYRHSLKKLHYRCIDGYKECTDINNMCIEQLKSAMNKLNSRSEKRNFFEVDTF